MNLVFCGTPQFAVPTLERLVESGHEVNLVVTQPDRPRGRGMELAFSPVKQAALRLGLPVAQPEKIKNNDEFRDQLSLLAPEAIIVVGYGRIIPRWMIDLPPLGNLNVHASLLPKYRGAAPIQWAIANGESITGVTIMRIDEGLDTGDILAQAELPIAPDDTSITLAPLLAAMGADLMRDTLPQLERGEITPQPQDHGRSSLAPIISKEDGAINFAHTAKRIYDRMRGFQPWPGVYTTFRGKKLTVHLARPHAPLASGAAPGELVRSADSLFAVAANSALELLEVQMEGRKRMTARDFANGYRLQSGELLGVSAPTPSAS